MTADRRQVRATPEVAARLRIEREVSKYTRLSHPHVPGVAGRTKIKQQFRQTPGAVDYRFPPKWGLPPERTATLRNP